MRKVAVWSTIGVTAILFGGVRVPSTTAQETPTIHLVPRAGYQSGGPVLTSLRFPETISGEFVPNLGLPVDMSESAVLGVAIEMDLPVRWLAFRASVDRTLLSDLQEPPAVDCGEECVAIGPGPSTEVGDLGKWSFGTDVVFQPVPRAWAFRPFATIGTGVDWYRFDEELERENALSRGTTDRWTATAHLGFGMDVRIAGRTIRSEVGFYRSEREHVLGWAHQRIAPPTLGHPVTTSRHQDVVQFTIGLRSPL